MKKTTTVWITAVTLMGVAASAGAFEGTTDISSGVSHPQRHMPFEMRRPDPLIDALRQLALTSDQKNALKTLESRYRDEMDRFRSIQMRKEEEILSALDENGFDAEKFSEILQQRCTKERTLEVSHLKEIMALLSQEQIEALKNQLKKRSTDDPGY
ncbi:MAG TPA: hypothetical protein ENL02_03125 [Epsilonproteobacteria bacterium]|nr:hypothetical protein [Campylobacterota bacterium]